MPFLPRLLAFGQLGISELVLAVERLLHKAVAVLQQIGADLAACTCEGVDGIQVHTMG